MALSEGDDYLPTHMLEVSIVEDNHTEPDLQDVLLESEEVDEENEQELNIIRAPSTSRKRRIGLPVLPTSPDEFDYYNRLFPDLSIVRYFRIHCTICDCHIGCSPNSIDLALRHRVLGTLVCQECYVFYGGGEFPQGEDESEIYCRWCGQGGRLICCSACPSTFCKKCISRNFTKRAKLEFENKIDWECFICDPRLIWEHRAVCWAVIQYIQKENEDWKCGIERGGEVYGPKVPAPGDDASVCCKDGAFSRRITAGLPEENRLMVFVQAAIRHKNVDANCEKNLLQQLNREKWIASNNVPRIKARDISELIGEKKSNSDTPVQPSVINPVPILNTNDTSNLNSPTPQMTPMVQIPTKTIPTLMPLSGQQGPQIAAVFNPANPTMTPCITNPSAPANFPQYGQYIVKAVANPNSNLVRLPIVTSSQLNTPKVKYYPNPVALIRCPTSQAANLSPQLYTSLTQGTTHMMTNGLQQTNPKSLTKFSIANGQVTLLNEQGCFYVNAGQKRFVTPVLQQIRCLPHPTNVSQDSSSFSTTRVTSVTGTTPTNSVKSSEIQTNLKAFPREKLHIPARARTMNVVNARKLHVVTPMQNIIPAESTSKSIDSLIENTLSSSIKPKDNAVPSDENFALSLRKKYVESLQQHNPVPGNTSVDNQQQLGSYLQDADEISRNMSYHVMLMRKMYKTMKQGDLSRKVKLAKRLQRLLRTAIEKMSAVDDKMLKEMSNYLNAGNSDKDKNHKNPVANIECIDVDLASSCEESVEKDDMDMQENWNLSDPSDSDVEICESHVPDKPRKVYGRKKSVNNEGLTLSDLLESSRLSDRNSVLSSPLKCPLSQTELQKSMSCIVSVKKENLDAPIQERNNSNNKRLPNPKERNSKPSIRLLKEKGIKKNNCHIPAKWAKLIRPCSVLLTRQKYSLGNNEINIAF